MHWDAAKVFLPEDKYGYECSYKEYSVESVNRLIAEARKEGFLVSYNHPVWSQQSYPDYIGLQGLFGVEIHNTECKRMGYYDTVAPWCDLLKSGERLFPLATDDAHSVNGALGGWIWVMADELEYGAVFEALEKGDFYASTGPEITRLTWDGKFLEISCSDARSITVESGNRYARIAAPVANDGLLRQARFDMRPWLDRCNGHPYDWLRVVVHGPYGHYASTRAYTYEELK
jgi:hypothetical protein